MSLLSLGVHLHDDVADNGLAAHWAGYRLSEVNLAATTLCAALPQCVIADLDVPPARRAAIQRTVANALLGMASGQQRDLALAGSPHIDAAEAEAIAVAKTGEELVLCIVPAAQLFGATPVSTTAGNIELWTRQVAAGSQLQLPVLFAGAAAQMDQQRRQSGV